MKTSVHLVRTVILIRRELLLKLQLLVETFSTHTLETVSDLILRTEMN